MSFNVMLFRLRTAKTCHVYKATRLHWLSFFHSEWSMQSRCIIAELVMESVYLFINAKYVSSSS